jgi:hypothetical protein
MNRGDPQNGSDTDQFPNDLKEITLTLYYVLKGGLLYQRWLQFRREGAAPEYRPGRSWRVARILRPRALDPTCNSFNIYASH